PRPQPAAVRGARDAHGSCGRLTWCGLLLLQPGREDRLGGAQRLGEDHLALAVFLPLGEKQVRVLAARLELVAFVELDEPRVADVTGLHERLHHQPTIAAPNQPLKQPWNTIASHYMHRSPRAA